MPYMIAVSLEMSDEPYFLKQSILPFTIGSDMEPLLPEWYWVRHHSISLFF